MLRKHVRLDAGFRFGAAVTSHSRLIQQGVNKSQEQDTVCPQYCKSAKKLLEACSLLQDIKYRVVFECMTSSHKLSQITHNISTEHPKK